MAFKDNKEKFYFSIIPVDGYIVDLFEVYPDKSFKAVNRLSLRIDDVLETPYSIIINAEEFSITVNEKYGILLNSMESLNIFIEEFFYVMEEFNNVPPKLRTSINKRIIKNLGKELNKMEKKYVKELDDIETIKK